MKRSLYLCAVPVQLGFPSLSVCLSMVLSPMHILIQFLQIMGLKALPADDPALLEQLQAAFDEFIDQDSDRLINLPAHVSERLEEYVLSLFHFYFSCTFRGPSLIGLCVGFLKRKSGSLYRNSTRL